MEFLDDLINTPEPDEESEKPSVEGAATGPETAPEAAPAAMQDEAAWTDLLESVTYEEGQSEAAKDEKPKKPRPRNGKGLGLSTPQKIILGVLSLVVLGIWAFVILRVVRTFSAREVDVPRVTVVSYTQVTPVSAKPTEDPPVEVQDDSTIETEDDAMPSPEVTPSATPPVFTPLDREIRSDPDNIELYIRRADAYINAGAYDAALADLETARETDETRAEIYVHEGLIYFYTGYWQRAEETLGTAVSYNEDLPEAHFALGQVLFYQGRYAEAAAEFDWAAEIDPSLYEAEAWLAISAAKMGDSEEAYGAVGRAISLTQTSPIVYIAQSWARRTEKPPDVDAAQADLLYAQDLKDNDFLTLNALAAFYVDNRPERLAEAELLASYAHNWATNDVERAVALQTLARVYLEQDRKADAERALIEAADLTARDGTMRLAGLTEDLDRARD